MLLTITLTCRGLDRDGPRDTREGGGNVGRQYRHVRRGLNGLNR